MSLNKETKRPCPSFEIKYAPYFRILGTSNKVTTCFTNKSHGSHTNHNCRKNKNTNMPHRIKLSMNKQKQLLHDFSKQTYTQYANTYKNIPSFWRFFLHKKVALFLSDECSFANCIFPPKKLVCTNVVVLPAFKDSFWPLNDLSYLLFCGYAMHM